MAVTNAQDKPRGFMRKELSVHGQLLPCFLVEQNFMAETVESQVPFFLAARKYREVTRKVLIQDLLPKNASQGPFKQAPPS